MPNSGHCRQYCKGQPVDTDFGGSQCQHHVYLSLSKFSEQFMGNVHFQIYGSWWLLPPAIPCTVDLHVTNPCGVAPRSKQLFSSFSVGFMENRDLEWNVLCILTRDLDWSRGLFLRNFFQCGCAEWGVSSLILDQKRLFFKELLEIKCFQKLLFLLNNQF
jgi:hypothetical protein